LTTSKQITLKTLRKVFPMWHMIFISKILTETEPVHMLTLVTSLSLEQLVHLKTHLSSWQLFLQPWPIKSKSSQKDLIREKLLKPLWPICMRKLNIFGSTVTDTVKIGQFKHKSVGFMSTGNSHKFWPT
jgi:hypothetical protein